MNDFAPVVVRQQSALAPSRGTDEQRRWGSYKTLVKEQLSGAVTGVTFSPNFPYELAAANTLGVSIFNSTVGEIRKSIGRFKGTAHSPSFKPDGRLLVAGDDNACVQVFDLANRTILRQFKGHSSAVWTTKFSLDGLRVLSGSDDTTVRMWDLATAKSMLTLKEAGDYVRAQAGSPVSKHVWCVGSYDRKARVYDLRSNEVICTFDHGSKIDDVVILPGGLRTVTVGGSDVKIWDMLYSGRLSHRVSNHAKAVTCCAVHPENDRLMTGGQDGQVKIMDTSSFKTCASLSLKETIVSLAISADGKRIATGTLEGHAEIRVAKSFDAGLPQVPQDGGLKERQFEGWGLGFVKPKFDGPKRGTKRFYSRGMFADPEREDLVVSGNGTQSVSAYDQYLRSFSHGRALAAAAETKSAPVLIAVVEELASRRALKIALCSCSEEGVKDILTTVGRHIEKPRFTSSLTDIVHLLVEERMDDFGASNEFGTMLESVLKKVRRQIEICNELRIVEGYLDSVEMSTLLQCKADLL